MSDISRAVVKRREEVGFTQQELADRAGVSLGYIRNIEQGLRGKALNVTTLKKLANALGTTVDALTAGGDGSPRAGQPKTVPIVGIVAAGVGRDEPAATTELVPLPPEFESAGADAVYEVRGLSMIGAQILDGDRIYVRRGPGCNTGDVVVAWIRDYGCVVKRAAVDTARNVTLHSEGEPGDKRYPYAMDDGDRVYGVVVGLQRLYGAPPKKGKAKKK